MIKSYKKSGPLILPPLVRIVPHIIKETAQGRVGVLGYMGPDAAFICTDNRQDLQFLGSSREGK